MVNKLAEWACKAVWYTIVGIVCFLAGWFFKDISSKKRKDK